MNSAALPETLAPENRSFLSPIRLANVPQRRLGILVSCLIAAVYALPLAHRGWVPHDEGTVAQSAERVLNGELPHRDYDEAYTGLLSHAHAFAFRVLGIRLSSLRWLLYVSFVLFVAAVASIALRLLPPAGALLVSLLAAAWSVPNYFASVPSWYNLFFATFGALALLRHAETRRSRWLWAAGVCGGLSILMKTVGAYYVAAALLYLVYFEETLSETEGQGARRERSGFLVFVSTMALALVILISLVFVHAPQLLRKIANFALPPALIVGGLLCREWRYGTGRSRHRFQRLSRLLLPFAVGVILPVAVYLVPYWMTDSVGALVRGLFVVSMRQTATATRELPPANGVGVAVLALVVLLWPAPPIPSRTRRAVDLTFGAGLAILFARSASGDAYQTLWSGARALAIGAPLAAALVASGRAASASALRRNQVFLLGSLAAFLPLVQFPFSAPIYFCYAAPMVILALAAVASVRPGGSTFARLALLVAFLAFAVFRMHPGSLSYVGWRADRYDASGRLDGARGGLRIPAAEAQDYNALLATVRTVAPTGTIFAFPDVPEVYFLSGRRNPTRYFFDFQSDDYGREDEAIRLLEANDVRAVILKDLPSFSRPPSPWLRRAIADRYPRSKRIGHFIVFWRDTAPAARNL